MWLFLSASLLLILFSPAAMSDSLSDLRDHIGGMNKEIQYLESRLSNEKITSIEKRRLHYELEEKKEALQRQQMIFGIMSDLEDKAKIDGFDLVESVTFRVVNFLFEHGLPLDDAVISSTVSNILTGRTINVDGRLVQFIGPTAHSTRWSYSENPQFNDAIIEAQPAETQSGFAGFAMPFQFSGRDRASAEKYHAMFKLGTPIKNSDQLRLQNFRFSEKDVSVEGIITGCQDGVCNLGEWVIIR
jgi:hypothetical protein